MSAGGIADWMERRRREVAGYGRQAEAAAQDAWNAATRAGQDLRLARPSDVMAFGASLLQHDQARPSPRLPAPASAAQRGAVGPRPRPVSARPPQPSSATQRPSLPARASVAVPAPKPRTSVGHPGFAESLIPVWGSGREAVADFQEGDYAGAALNGALAASDLFLAGSVAKGLAKGGLYMVKGTIGEDAAKSAWKAVRKDMGDRGLLEKGQHGHHWAIPQRGWGKSVPAAIRNHPLNIKPMPSAQTHWRIEHRVGTKPRFNSAQRYWYGTPDWAKVGTGAAVGHPAAAARAGQDGE